jgi:hypothetical protein
VDHLNLINYLSLISDTKFPCEIGETGGYVCFKNSGQRGSVKEFTLSLASILSGLRDIQENITTFQLHTTYVEKEWRDLGSSHFKDLSLNSMITVQTKPAFTTFSKIICWANDIEYPGDNTIHLENNQVENTITRLETLIESYTPSSSAPPLIKRVSGDKIALSKPFILLAGISGTGKTRFVREQACNSHTNTDNFCLVPVRPDWHEPSDLLGYISRIGGKPKYISTKVLKFIIASWMRIAPTAGAEGSGELDFTSPPYWLCLDEMNLAPVEQYFSDYLSALESRKFENEMYSCDPLLDIPTLNANCDGQLQSDLGLEGYDGLWEYFLHHGLSLPPNLIVAGTVNMDETTHGFSRKVIDRAISIDFGEFFPNEYSRFFAGQAIPKVLTYGIMTQASIENCGSKADPDCSKSIEFLESVNDVLRNTPFELAYRALNELLLHVGMFAPESAEKLQAIWDDFLMTKVLPRIDGDEDKLRIPDSDGSANLLSKLESVLKSRLDLIWAEDKIRIDLLRENSDGTDITDVACRSRKKISWMNQRLTTNTFTSYWP